MGTSVALYRRAQRDTSQARPVWSVVPTSIQDRKQKSYTIIYLPDVTQLKKNLTDNTHPCMYIV